MRAQLLSRVQLFATPWTAAHQASLSFTVSRSLLKPMCIESVMTSNHLILLSPSPALNLSQIRVFSNESVLCIKWPKFWSFSFSISPSNEYTELTFRMDWLDLLVVQGTLKSLLQHHSLKVSILRHSTFFMVWFYFFLVRNAIPLLNVIWAFHHLFFHILGTSKYGNDLDCPDL